MFAQANSEHCRHKIFNAELRHRRRAAAAVAVPDDPQQHRGEPRRRALRVQRQRRGDRRAASRRASSPTRTRGVYGATREPVHILMKVETHNHPTAISPFPGAATGSGGEIRDEGATGRGGQAEGRARPASRVSNLRLPGALRPWEATTTASPTRIASRARHHARGAARRRRLQQRVRAPEPVPATSAPSSSRSPGPAGREVRGYHKPIMLAGGFGNIRARARARRREIPPGAPIVVLGGPGDADRARRRRGVVDGVGRLARGSRFRLRAAGQRRDAAALPGGHRPLLGARRREPDRLDPRRGRGRALERAARARERQRARRDASSCARSRATSRACRRSRSGATRRRSATCSRSRPSRLARVRGAVPRASAVRTPCVGHATADGALVARRRALRRAPIDHAAGGAARQAAQDDRAAPSSGASAPRALRSLARSTLREAARRVLRLPTVADKTFLITIGDRTVGGMVARDQMVGPVAGAGRRRRRHRRPAFDGFTGEAMAMGERAPARAARRGGLGAHGGRPRRSPTSRRRRSRASSDVKLSANWMAAAGHPGEDARLYDAVRAVGAELCPALGIAIPVGKDSMSMRTVWEDGGERAPSRRRCRSS